MKKFKITEKDFEKLTAPTEPSTAEEEESEKKKKLKEDLLGFQKEYESSQSRTYSGIEIPNVVEKKYVAPTKEETETKVTQTVTPLYDAKMQTVKDENEFEQRQKEDDIDLIYQRAKESLSEIDKSYGKSKENLSDEAIKRGLARSSIVASQLADLEKAKLGAQTEILNKRDSDVGKKDQEINDLKVQLYNKIAELNGEKAIDIATRMDELFKEYALEQDEVFKYNNELRQKRADMIAEAMANGLDLSEQNSDEYKKMIVGKTKSMYSYYYSFGKDAAEEMQKDKDFIIEHLGKKGYETLLRYFE